MKCLPKILHDTKAKEFSYYKRTTGVLFLFSLHIDRSRTRYFKPDNNLERTLMQICKIPGYTVPPWYSTIDIRTSWRIKETTDLPYLNYPSSPTKLMNRLKQSKSLNVLPLQWLMGSPSSQEYLCLAFWGASLVDYALIDWMSPKIHSRHQRAKLELQLLLWEKNKWEITGLVTTPIIF